MTREKSVKVRLTELEDNFLNEQSEKFSITRSEYMRRLLHKEIEKGGFDMNRDYRIEDKFERALRNAENEVTSDNLDDNKSDVKDEARDY